MNLGKTIAHIPARAGSKRVPSKNLRYLAGRPLIAYAINTALACERLDEVYVNTDSEVIASLAESMGCAVYRRDPRLGTDDTSGDDFTIDFIEANSMDTLVMISPVCPLIDATHLAAALDAYEESKADTLITCSETRLQVFCEDRPVNVAPLGPLAPTQKNQRVYVCNWAITIWNVSKFRELYSIYRGGYFGEQRIFWPIDPLQAIKISDEKDFRLAEALLLVRGELQTQGVAAPRYWRMREMVL